MRNKILISTILSLPIFALATDKVKEPVVTTVKQAPSAMATVSTPTESPQANVVITKPSLVPNTTSGVDVQQVPSAPVINDVDENTQKIQRMIYDPNKVITLYANPFVTTTIEFSQDEVITGNNITNGDNGSWMYETYNDKLN